jgi:TetR/AcrR family transcriptional regulator, cholesterol catabolism regulator
MADRRSEILTVAKEMFAERGIKSTTVRQIGASAGILSGSLYHHFGSKFDIIDAILAEFCEQTVTNYSAILAGDGDSVTKLRRMTRYAFSLITDNPAAVIMIQNESNLLSQNDRFDYLQTTDRKVESMWIDVVRAGIKEGSVRSSIDARMFYRVVRDSVAGSIRWYKPSKTKKIEDVADEVIAILLYGILVPGQD